MSRNFYVVLGVSRDADLEQIRQAYRQLVHRYHPDKGGTPPERFHEVREAYETLRDDATRREHDARLEKPRSAPLTQPPARRPQPAHHLFGAADDFFGGWVPGLYNTGRMATRHKDLYVELILNPDEAFSGGLYTLEVPVHEVCKSCGGTGWSSQLACPACRGRSVAYPEIKLSVPPRVPEGTRVRLSLEDVGLRDVFLNVLVSVR
jgi:DnaJ-class molecular chaperone